MKKIACFLAFVSGISYGQDIVCSGKEVFITFTPDQSEIKYDIEPRRIRNKLVFKHPDQALSCTISAKYKGKIKINAGRAILKGKGFEGLLDVNAGLAHFETESAFSGVTLQAGKLSGFIKNIHGPIAVQSGALDLMISFDTQPHNKGLSLNKYFKAKITAASGHLVIGLKPQTKIDYPRHIIAPIAAIKDNPHIKLYSFNPFLKVEIKPL